jgi:hypothetical protein
MADEKSQTQAPAEKAPKAATAKYRAVTYIEHDGEPVQVGEPLTLTAAQAKPLLDVKAIEPAGAKAKADQAGDDA